MVKLGHGLMVTWWNGMGPRCGSSLLSPNVAYLRFYECVWSQWIFMRWLEESTWILDKLLTHLRHIVVLVCFWPPRGVWYDAILISSGIKSAPRCQHGEEFTVIDKYSPSEDHIRLCFYWGLIIQLYLFLWLFDPVVFLCLLGNELTS